MTPKQERGLRAELVRQLEARGVDAAEWREAVDAYVRAIGDVVRLRAEWKADGYRGTVPGGATGRVPVPNPLVPLIDTAEKRAAELRRRLMLEPLAAAGRRVGKPTGAVSAPDRVAKLPDRVKLQVVK